jgi:hypothetical protein
MADSSPRCTMLSISITFIGRQHSFMRKLCFHLQLVYQFSLLIILSGFLEDPSFHLNDIQTFNAILKVFSLCLFNTSFILALIQKPQKLKLWRTIILAGFAIIAAYILESIPSSHHKLETYPCKTKGQHAGLHLLGIQNATKTQKRPNTVGDVFTSPVFENVVISLLMLLGAHVAASIISVSGIQYPSSTPGILSYLSSNTSL